MNKWCPVCGAGLALDASNAHSEQEVCSLCVDEGWKGRPGEDVDRAVLTRHNSTQYMDADQRPDHTLRA
jgi:hypothetical protein